MTTLLWINETLWKSLPLRDVADVGVAMEYGEHLRGLIWLILIVGFMVMIPGLIGCDENILPTTPSDESYSPMATAATTTSSNGGSGSEAGDTPDIKGCDAIKIIQRRGIPGTNKVLLEVVPTIDFDGSLYVKFIRDNCGIPHFLYTGLDIPTNEVFEVELHRLPCGRADCYVDSWDHKVYVYVEGYIGDRLYQCDGSVQLQYSCDDCLDCECRGDCPPPPPPPCVGCDCPGVECPLPEEPICHVSNKGRDGNWNLQESQKYGGEGHIKHLNAEEFCPPDYYGLCDGRYDLVPHPCMEENEQ
jgi:hypothetical protein